MRSTTPSHAARPSSPGERAEAHRQPKSAAKPNSREPKGRTTPGPVIVEVPNFKGEIEIFLRRDAKGLLSQVVTQKSANSQPKLARQAIENALRRIAGTPPLSYRPNGRKCLESAAQILGQTVQGASRLGADHMASVSQGRRRRQGSFESQRQAVSQPPKKRRWLKRLVACFTLLAVLVLALPTIISYTGLRNSVLRLALGNIHGTVQAGGASLSWFSGLQYSDLELRDERGEAIFTVSKIESERSLLGLLTHMDDLGTFRIVHPQATVVLRPDGSNFEDVLEPLLAKKEHEPNETKHESTGGKMPAVAVEIVDGTFKLNDTATKQNWELDNFKFKVRMSPENTLPTEIAMSAEVPFEGRTARLAITGAPGENSGHEEINLKIDALPLAMFRGLADRFAPGLQLAGSLSTDLHCTGIATTSTVPLQISGSTAIDGFEMTGGPIATDHVVLRRIELPCKLTYQNKRLDIEQFGLGCDVGQLGISGSIALPEKMDAEVVKQLERTAITAQGKLNLAQIAAMLPATLHVRQGTQITSGQIQLAVAGKPGQNVPADFTWTAQLTASDLAAVDNGRRVAWEQPINLQVALRNTAGNYSIDQLNCTASFLSLTGSGSLDALQIDASCDLDKLMSELNQFLDLGATKLAGRGSARLAWQRASSGVFQSNIDVRLQGLQVALPGAQPWQDDSLAASLAVSGNVENLSLSTLASANLRRLDTAQLTATIDNGNGASHEEIGVRLAQPVDCSTPNSRWPIEARVQGQVGRWWPRIASWIGMNDLELGGACDIGLQAAYSKAGIEIQQCQANMTNLHVWGFDTLYIDEPQARIEASGGYEFNSGRLVLNRTALLTTSASLQTESATISMPSAGPFSAQGTLSYSANLERLSKWITDPRTPPEFTMTGMLTGTAEMAHGGTATNGRIAAAVDGFRMFVFDEDTRKSLATGRQNPARVPKPFWQEAKLTFGATGGFDSAADAVQLTALEVNSQALAIQAVGKIEQLKTKQNVNLAGTVNYDWDTIGPLLKPYLGKHIDIDGRHSRKFAIRGPLGTDTPAASVNLVSAKATTKKAKASQVDDTKLGDSLAFLKPLVADFSLGWSHADIYGLRFGKLDVDAHMENGTVNFQPIDTSIGDAGDQTPGRLTVAPLAQLTPNPSQIVLGKGPLLKNVDITDELSNTWMKYVAPAMADATRTSGTVSVDLNEARVPLDDPMKADLSGRLTIKNVSVQPGPLAAPLVLIGQQMEAVIKKRPPQMDMGRETALMKIDNQKIDFHMADGRVYHQGLNMQVGDVTITTRGWVGVDETLGLVAEIPIKPEWAQKNPALAGMREQVIRIPITGTLSKPKLDKRAIDQIAGSLIEGAVRGTIENELGKQLNKLFQPQE